jgi:hypothetical protein
MNGLRGKGALDQALARNMRGENIYFALNIVRHGVVKKPSDREIETIHAVCGDIDWDRKRFRGQFQAGLAEINTKLETLKALALPPTRIIHTGGGLQPIWRFEPLGHTPEIAQRVRAVGKAIRRRFGGDAVHDLSRILRLPGTVNRPKKDKRDAGQLPSVAQVVFDSGRVYALEELEREFNLNDGGGSPPQGCLTTSEEFNRDNDNLAFDEDHDDLGAGVAERDLAICEDICRRIASIPNGPFSARQGWRNPATAETVEVGWLTLLFVLRGIADNDESLAQRCKRLFDECSAAAGGDTSENEAQWARQAAKAAQRVAGGQDVITVGTLLKLHSQVAHLIPPDVSDDGPPNDGRADNEPPDGGPPGGGGGDEGPTLGSGPSSRPGPQIGGVYPPTEATLQTLAARYRLVKEEGRVIPYRHDEEKGWLPSDRESMKLELANIKVSRAKKGAFVSGYDWYCQHPNRPKPAELVFKPHGNVGPNEINLWTGFGVERNPARDKLNTIFEFMTEVSCGEGQDKYHNLMWLCAWACQHPELPPEVILVLKSDAEGTGKTYSQNS